MVENNIIKLEEVHNVDILNTNSNIILYFNNKYYCKNAIELLKNKTIKYKKLDDFSIKIDNSYINISIILSTSIIKIKQRYFYYYGVKDIVNNDNHTISIKFFNKLDCYICKGELKCYNIKTNIIADNTLIFYDTKNYNISINRELYRIRINKKYNDK